MQREVRVHGVSGTPPRDILYTDPVTISPVDGPTKIYQRREADPGFDTIAFHWASLTSGSPHTALWILLAPYSLANAAGWMAGWRHPPTRGTDSPDPFHMVFGRTAVRAAGLVLTALFVVQAVTAVVVLPQADGAQLHWGPIDISFEWMSRRPATTLLVLVVAILFYWLVAYVSTRSHFSEQRRRTGVTALIFEPSGKSMVTASRIPEGFSPDEDPAGARVGDPRLWGVHAMLHRLRRLHLGMGLFTLAVVVMVMTGWVSRFAGLVCLLIVALVAAAITTHLPQSRWTWRVTSWVPLAALTVFAASIVSLLVTDPEEWWLGSVHSFTFGIAAVLGFFVALSLFAGPLSVGALVLATFFGAVLGTSVGLIIDRVVLDTNVLISQGVGWVSVAMLALLVWLALAAVVASRIGRRKPEQGATEPLPECATIMGLIRRIVIEGRILFHAAGLFGLVSLIYGLARVWSHGSEVTGETASFWQKVREGMDPAALHQLPEGLVNVGVAVALLGPGLFALRSIWRGWRGGRAGEDRRRRVGILWDLGSFWPRWFHPLAPPSYGPKAIEDLRTQLDHDSSDLILAAHSQGSLLSAVAIRLSNRPTRFITYGSQLGILYPRMFPATGIPDLVDEVVGLCPKWINLWRDSDPIGGHYVDDDRVDNRLVSEGKGHSGYEITEDYRVARREV